jgi:hypothetical protein
MIPTDRDVRAHFQTRRRLDTADAPSFEAMVGTAVRNVRRPSRVRRRAAWFTLAAASIFVGVIGLLRVVRLRDAHTDAHTKDVFAQRSILSWSPPSAGLLDLANRSIVTSMSPRGLLVGGSSIPTFNP